MKNFRRAQQRLGRDAAPVQANPAQIGFFNDRGLETKLRRANGGDIAAGAGTDDDDVEGCVGHVYSLVLIVCFVIARSSCDEAIQPARVALDCFASLAMTA